MKKISLFLAVLFISTAIIAQKKMIYIKTDINMTYQVFIDGELQSYGLGSEYKINAVTPGKKMLSIKTLTQSNQSPSIEIGTSSDKIEYYEVMMSKEKKDQYIITKKAAFKFKAESNPTFCNYIAKRIPAKLDSNYKQPHSCKVTDSIVNQTIKSMLDLKDKKAREALINSKFSRKCLESSQLRSIGYRITDDKEKYDMYMKYYKTCIDNVDYKILIETFTNQEYNNKFEAWLKEKY
jgi:hypothetical protein